MPWYSITLSASDILAARDSTFERLFRNEFIDGERQSAASLWFSHILSDGSIIYFLSATTDEIEIESIAGFSPTECKEPDLSAVKLLHTRTPLTVGSGQNHN